MPKLHKFIINFLICSVCLPILGVNTFAAGVDLSVNTPLLTAAYAVDLYNLADFENAVITLDAVDSSKSRLVWSDGFNNQVQYDYPGHNSFISLNTADAGGGQKMLSLGINFGQDNSGADNWGAFISFMRTNSEVPYAAVPYNLSGYQALSFNAVAPILGSNSVEVGLTLVEDNADATAVETWESVQRVSVDGNHNLSDIVYRFGLKQSNFTLTKTSSSANKTLDLSQIKMIMLTVYKNDLKTSQKIYLNVDNLTLGNDFAPAVSGLTYSPDPISKGNFQVTVNVGSAVGLDLTNVPVVLLVPVVGAVIPLSITAVSANVVVAAGQLPATVTATRGVISVTNIIDLNRQSAAGYSVSVNIDVTAKKLTLDNAILINNQNSLSVINGQAKVDLNLAIGADNWGSILQVPVPSELEDFTSCRYLIFSSKASKKNNLKTKIALVEKSGEKWEQKDSYRMDYQQSYVAGCLLNQSDFVVDTQNSVAGSVDNVLDLSKIAYVQIYLWRDTQSTNTSVTLDNLTLTSLDFLPPVTPLINGGVNIISIAENKPTLNLAVTLSADTVAVTSDIADYVFNAAKDQLTLTNLRIGDNYMNFVAIDAQNNRSVPFYLTVSCDTLPIPTLETVSAQTYASNYDICGHANDDNAIGVKILLNNQEVQQVTINVLDRSFIAKNVSLVATDNVITVKTIYADNRASAQSEAITISKKEKRLEFRLSVESKLDYPIMLIMPPDCLAKEETPTITMVANTVKTLPKGRQFTTSELKMFELTFTQSLKKSISLYVPVDGLSNNYELWSYDVTQNSWLKIGSGVASNITVYDSSLHKEVQVPYFTVNTSSAARFAILMVNDITPPVVDTLTLDQKTIYKNDYVQTSPVIAATFRDNQDRDTGVSSWNIELLEVNTNKVTPVGSGSLTTPQDTQSVSYTAKNLISGKYVVKVTVTDVVGNQVISSTPTFNICSDFKIVNALNGPNPFNPNKEPTKFQYQLTKDADVNIYVYTISGRLVWEQKINKGDIGGVVGFNNVEWAGKNRFEELVSNGVYVAYIIAKCDGETVVAKVKMAVLK